jgi:hypothetical protein
MAGKLATLFLRAFSLGYSSRKLEGMPAAGCGVVWCGVVRVWCGVVWCGAGVVWCGCGAAVVRGTEDGTGQAVRCGMWQRMVLTRSTECR